MRATRSGSAGAEGDTSPLMPHTTGTRYAVVSCHVERPLDDVVRRRFLELQIRRPGGFRIATLVRPADEAAGEDGAAWLECVLSFTDLGSLGHHTHWTAPDHARPTRDGAGERVLEEGRRLRELGLAPKVFCGGGWYTDEAVAEACADLGYVDCTPRASRPPYLGDREAWASLAAPSCIRLPSGRVLGAIPTTHSLGDLARALARPWSLPPVVHVYFHDTDLLDGRRRALLRVVLPLLQRLARPSDLETLTSEVLPGAPEVAWADVARP
jgi:hypothetical protein